ncbi:MAG TPA: hypothetical protein VE956_01185 [Nodularia sp. (in: cyanobacteria)]|nr:hypothetical protein [Nodularia sp. (in: cyanobacteria)]
MAVAAKKLITPDIFKSVLYLGNERLTANKPWHTALIRWELTYPEAYEVGYS